MTRSATRDLAAATRPRWFRTVACLTVAVLAGGVAAAYQVGVAGTRGPSFEGGSFLTVDDLARAGEDGRPYPYGAPGDDGSPAASTSTSAAPDVSITGRTPRAAAEVPATAPTTAPAVAAAPSPAAPAAAATDGPVVPRTGSYTYAVTGTESATGFGSRAFPSTAGLVVHPAEEPGALVHDLRLSGEHEERQVVRYDRAGAALLFEAGSVTFGPGTQTSQGTYEPPMVQVPWPLAVGAEASGTSPVTPPGGGDPSRTEVWTSRVVGQEELDVLGERRTTWVVDVQRNTTPGGPEQVDRFRRYWYDPVSGMWVRWTERMRGERRMGFTFTYASDYTATLTGFTPG